jgi:ubiquinone/menaquinone biosynthesis C-methylase UbiE
LTGTSTSSIALSTHLDFTNASTITTPPQSLPTPLELCTHDVGAGAGIVSETLAEKFTHVIVSEPNLEYIQMAEGCLSALPQGFPKDKFSFHAESAEKSSIPDASVDCVTICEAIYWTDMPAAVSEFARQLESGGSLCICALCFSTDPQQQRGNRTMEPILL